MNTQPKETSLQLTENEAMGLLDILLLTSTDMTEEQQSALAKISDACREFIRCQACNVI